MDARLAIEKDSKVAKAFYRLNLFQCFWLAFSPQILWIILILCIRHGLALINFGLFEQASTDLVTALKLIPNNQQIEKLLENICEKVGVSLKLSLPWVLNLIFKFSSEGFLIFSWKWVFILGNSDGTKSFSGQ